MSAEVQATASGLDSDKSPQRPQLDSRRADGPNPQSDEEEEDEEEDDEPKLKYAKLTGSLAGVYRNGDFTTAFCVAGDKMVMGTQDGNIHVLSLPTLEGLRTYHAHSASITSCSVSPVPPPPALVRTQDGTNSLLTPPAPLGRPPSMKPEATNSSRIARQPQPAVPNVPSNQIYIATSSIDGHVCVSSLVDPKDVQLRNFARPVQAVALSPDYKTDRTYLSGGRAGNLILTVGGKAGVSADANTNSAAAAASGWFGSMGLGSNTGKDTILHQGEGSISTVKWSLSGKWVVWVNEEGIKIMRSHLRLDSEGSEDAWKRIAHAAKPNRKSWEDMAGVWKARTEWVDERLLESDDLESATEAEKSVNGGLNGTGTAKSVKREKKAEKLVVGWGDTAWIMHVHEGGVVPSGRHAGERQVGSADIIHKLQFRDCIVSGLSLYTPSMLAILAYRTRDDDDKPIPTNNTPVKGRQRRHTSLAPHLRLVSVKDGEEVELDELSPSRFETLSAQDYHLGTLYMPPPLPERATKEQRGALEGLWEISGGGYATRMFSSGASVLSRSDSGKDENGKAGIASPRSGSIQGVTPDPSRIRPVDAHPFVTEPGLKLFIQSPYDCVLAVKTDLGDHLKWLLDHQQFEQAWNLLDRRPEIIDASTAELRSARSGLDTPSQSQKGSLADFFADSDSQTTVSAARNKDSAAAREKRRIGDLWLSQLVAAERWSEAGRVAGKVLEHSGRWEHWVFTFAQADKFDEITPHIPSAMLKPPLPSEVYEIILGHYIMIEPPRLEKLLDEWDTDLFDVQSIITAIESRLRSGEVTEQDSQDGVQGRDWRMLLEALARLYLANGQSRDALRCFIRTQNADAAMSLVRDEKLTESLADDIPGFVTLKISKQQMRSAPTSELEEASSEPIVLLVEEALRGSIPPMTVVQQLQQRGPSMQLFLFFYFRALWQGGSKTEQDKIPRRKFDRRVDEGRAMVEDYGDLAVKLFAEYDRSLLLEFLETSEVYNYDKAAALCEQRHYIPELVHVLSKTGQTKRALWLIIGELGDVKKAIAFVKEQPDLWDDLLEYGMDKPSFIKGLLEEVGTAVDPAELVRRIPVGLEIEGLKQGIMRLVKEYEIQYSISEGVAKVLRGEVAMGMDVLRAGQKKAVHFEVAHPEPGHEHITAQDIPTRVEGEELTVGRRKVERREAKPGHCVGCSEAFHEEEKEPLIGFACGHVYHLSCLLRANPDTSDDATIERLMSQLGYGGDEDPDEAAYTGRSVGAKVAHAHVIKNVVQGGCRCCVIPDGA